VPQLHRRFIKYHDTIDNPGRQNHNGDISVKPVTLLATTGFSVSLLLVLFTLLSIQSVSSQNSFKTLSSSGEIQYPQPPSQDYYSIWETRYRVDTDFPDYFTGLAFNFTGFFENLYTRFLQELETTVYGVGYQRPSLNYGSPTYNAGDPILVNESSLESRANYVVYQDQSGYVYYKDSLGVTYGGGDTIPNEISTAISLTPNGGIVFIKAGTYRIDSNSLIVFSTRTNLIIAGEGWNTTFQLADSVNWTPIRGTSGCQRIIVRDLMIDMNMAGNPDVTYTYGIDFTGGTPRNILIENVKVVNARRMGIVTREGNYVYFINDVVLNSGWNNMEHIRVSWGAAIGNYLQDARDVGYSTWGSHNIVVANNFAVGGIHDRLGFNDANWGLALENHGGGNATPVDSHDIVFRNNIAEGHNASDSTEPWKGTGIWIMGSDLPGTGSYNVIVDGNVMRYNNRAGLVITPDNKYPDLGNTIVAVNNYASGNNIYNVNSQNYGNYVIQRTGVLQSNNVEG